MYTVEDTLVELPLPIPSAALLPDPSGVDAITMPTMVERSAKVAKNTAILVVGQIVVQASMVIVGLMIARHFGESRYGQYTLSFSFVYLFALLFTFGVDAIIVREVARSRLNSWYMFSAGLWLRVVMFPLTVGAILLIARLAGYDAGQQQLIFITALAAGLSSMSDLARAVFQGAQRMSMDTLSRAVEKIGAVGLAFGALVIFNRLDAVLLGLELGAAIGLVFSWVMLRRINGRGRLHPARYGLWLMMRGAPVGASMVIIQLYIQLPPVILSLYLTYEKVGLYSAANAIIAPLMLLPVALGTALLPNLAEMTDLSEGVFKRTHYVIAGITLGLGVLLAALLQIFGGMILGILFGSSFKEAMPILRILSLMVPLAFINTYLTNFLIARDQPRLILMTALVNLVLTAGLALLLVPSAGAEGAAIGNVLGECAGTAFMLFVVGRLLSEEGVPAHVYTPHPARA